MGRKPDWCTWWSDGEWSRFERLLRVLDRYGVLTAKTQPPDAEPGAADVALRTVAEAVHKAPPGKWSATITDLVKQHGAANQESGNGGAPPSSPRSGKPHVDKPRLDEERAASLLSQVAVRDDVLGRFEGMEQAADPLARPLGGGLYEVLQLARSGARETPDRSFFSSWGEPDELFAAARENLRAETVEGSYDEAQRIYTLRNPDSDLVAARVTLFGEAKRVSPAGYLVMMPDRHCLMFHPVGGGGQVFAKGLSGLVAAGRGAYANAVSPFSDGLFWWHSGELVAIPVDTGGEEPKVDVPQELWDVVRAPAPAVDKSARGDRMPTTARELQQNARVQVMRQADALAAVSAPVMRSIGADLVEVVVVELEDDAVGFVEWDYLESHKANVDAVFEIARANVRAEQVTTDDVEIQGGADVHLLTSDDDSTYVAARVVLLGEESTSTPYGHLVMLPNPFTLLYHPIRNGQHLLQAFDMVPIARYMNDKMREITAGKLDKVIISDNPYWWREGTLTEIPVSSAGDGLRIDAPTSFRDMARALGAAL